MFTTRKHAEVLASGTDLSQGRLLRALGDGVDDIDREISMPLEGPVAGMTSFKVVGFILDQTVRGQWDGHRIRMTGLLHQAFLIAKAVEAVFCEVVADDLSVSRLDDPYETAIDLVRSLDYVITVEYSTTCELGATQRVWQPESHFDMDRQAGESVVGLSSDRGTGICRAWTLPIQRGEGSSETPNANTRNAR